MKDNPPVNVLLGESAANLEQKKVIVVYRDQLAARLGVSPKERLTMTLVSDDDHVFISVLLDGGDLTTDQELVLRGFLKEAGVRNIIASFAELPVTS